MTDAARQDRDLDRTARSSSFGQHHDLSLADRLGRWLSVRRIRRYIGSVDGWDAADIGCGYRADLGRQLLADAASVVFVDLALDPALRTRPDTRLIEGVLPGALGEVPDASLDIIVCNNVLEHVWEAELLLAELFRTLRSAGVLVVNVPSWWGKVALETAAFRLGLAPAAEMDDHKAYYDPRDLWPLLVRAGFRPRAVRCHRHKLGLNTIARCVKE